MTVMGKKIRFCKYLGPEFDQRTQDTVTTANCPSAESLDGLCVRRVRVLGNEPGEAAERRLKTEMDQSPPVSGPVSDS